MPLCDTTPRPLPIPDGVGCIECPIDHTRPQPDVVKESLPGGLLADGSLSVATPEPVNQLLLNLAYEYRDLLRAKLKLDANDEATRARIARCDEAIGRAK